MRASSSRVTGTLDEQRVAFVLETLRYGGAERQVLLLAQLLRDRAGAEVTVAGFSGPGRTADLCDEFGIPWHVVPFGWANARSHRIASLLRLARGLRTLKPTVLMPYTADPNFACGLIWRLTGARLCVWNQRDAGRPSHLPRWERAAVRLTPWFASNSSHGAGFLKTTFGVPSDRLRVIYNGVVPPSPVATRDVWRARLIVNDDSFVVCMAANLQPAKDPVTLVRAWRHVVDALSSEGRRALLVFAGRLDTQGMAAKAEAFDLDLCGSVRFLGAVDDVGGLLAASDICVLSSHTEGVPNGILEAMALGIPVVATDLPGCREALGDAGAAWLAPRGNAQGMADRIVRLARDAGERSRLGRLGRERIRTQFDPEHLVSETAEWLELGLSRRC